MEEFDGIKQQLEQAIEPILKDNFLELVEIDIMKGKHIRVRIDKIKEKISIEDCSNISKEISRTINLEEIASGNYSLEVSSPGIDRPLKKKEHFERFIGEQVKIATKEQIDNENTFVGIIVGVKEEAVVVDNEKTKVEIRFENIIRANLESDIFKGKRG